MAEELPYLPSYKNVPLLFEKIRDAKAPPTFTQPFLGDTLGLKSSGDRALIPFLRTLGFLDQANKPTQDYYALKNASKARGVIAAAIRRAYAPLFAANERAHLLTSEEARGLVAQVAATDASMTAKILGTFNALKGLADFSQASTEPEPDTQDDDAADKRDNDKPSAFRPDFHYNIQIHLPSNGTEETYLNIFNAIRRSFS
jgi:uncharacterized protein DUF5343